MDFTTLALIMGVGLGLIGLDAFTNTQTFGVTLNVPRELEAQGLTPTVVEDVFIAEVERITMIPTFLTRPEVRSASRESVIGALARTMQLEDVTFAAQRLLGFDPFHVNGTILPDATAPRMFVTVTSVTTGVFILDITGEKGDYIDLIRRAARDIVTRFGPYRSALYRFVHDAEFDGDFTFSETIILRELATMPRAETLERRGYLVNLLGMIALMRNDVRTAEAKFHEVLLIDPRSPVGHLNLAFVKLHQGQFEEARRIAQHVHEADLTSKPQLLTAAAALRGVASWWLGHHDDAAHRFRHAVRTDHRAAATAYEYWAMMLQDLGQGDEAELRKRQAIRNRQLIENYPEVAMLYFQADRGGSLPLKRRPH